VENLNIAIYTFDSDTDTLPTFNDGYAYKYTDVNNGDGTITRTITSDSLPTRISFNSKTYLVSLSYLDTSNVTSMEYMFANCNSLTSIDVSSFDTSKVTNMYGMFYNCNMLTSLDLSSFNISKVTNMDYMFYYCSVLTSLNLSNWDTSSVMTMYYTFYYCNNLNTVKMHNNNITSINHIIDSLPTGKSSNWGIMIIGDSDVNSINLSNANKKYWNVTNYLVAEYTFKSGTDTMPVFNDGFGDVMIECVVKKGNSYQLFDISYPTEIEIYTDDLKFVRTEEDENFIKYIYTDNISGNLTNPSQSYFMYGKKEDGYSYINLNSNYLDSVIFTVKVKGSGVVIKDEVLDNETKKRIIASNNLPTSINFAYKTGLVSLSYLNTSNVTNMGNMFSNCENMTSIDVSSFDTSKVTNMSQLFYKCTKLTTIEGLSNWVTSNVTDISHMFSRCYGLTELNLNNLNTSKVTNMSRMFQECNTLTVIGGLSNWDTSNVTDMSYMFDGCIELLELNLGSFDASKVTTMYSIFQNCKKLRTLNISNLDINDTANMSWMFYSCDSLISVNMDCSDINTINSIISNLPSKTPNNQGTLMVPNPEDNSLNTNSAQSKYWNLEAPPQYAFDINTITYFISKIKEKFAAISELRNKVDKEEGKNLSTNNFSNEEKDHIENSFNDVTLVDNILVFYSTSESGDKVIVETFDLDI
jgi:surface protein